MDYVTEAKALGFTDAAFMPVRELVIVPEYRVFCEENLCGNYNVLPACPPASGTVEEMTTRMRQYETALVLMVEHTPKDYTDRQEQKAAKRHQNELTEQLINRMHENGTTDTLMMGAGPWKTASCMSAYCVNAQKMADFVGMKCWDNDGKIRYFSLILF
jgi:predicted metal-binding protein